MTSSEKKETLTTTDFSIVIIPIEYEAHGLFLKNLLNQDFLKKLNDAIGDLGVANIAFYVKKHQEVVMLWHKSNKDAEKGVVTITCKNKEIKDALLKALGVEIKV